jgi:PPOX class probable F420-dependent enzyme
MTTNPDGDLDRRFSDPAAGATPWPEAAQVLETAELYWITTVRADGRPHVTPLIGLWHDGAMHFSTGLREQKARNLEHNPHVAMTTGNNTWAKGLDVVVEGTAERVADNDALQRVADAIEAKYGSAWHFDVGDGAFEGPAGEPTAVFRLEADKVMAFAKEPHGQTTYRFGRRRPAAG